MKKKLQELLDNYSSLLTLMEKRHDQDMARLHQIEVQLMNIVEIELNKKKPNEKNHWLHYQNKILSRLH